MYKHKTPLKEVDYRVGTLLETVLQSNIRLTSSVDNLRVTVQNLMAAEVRVKDIVLAQKELETKYKTIAHAR